MPSNTFFVVKELQCPTCGAPEMHSENHIHVRGHKVCDQLGEWWSQCLVCSGYYDKPFGTANVANHDPDKGWF